MLMCSQVFPRNTAVYNRRHEVWNLQIMQNFQVVMFGHHSSKVFLGCFRSLDSTSAAELFSGGPTRSSPGQWQNVLKDGKGRFIDYKISNITKPTCRVLLHPGRLFQWSWRPKELQLFPSDSCSPPVRCTWIDTWQCQTWSWEVGLRNAREEQNLL